MKENFDKDSYKKWYAKNRQFVDRALEVPQTLDSKFVGLYTKKYRIEKRDLSHLPSPEKIKPVAISIDKRLLDFSPE